MEADPLSQSIETVRAQNRIRTALWVVTALLAGALLRIWMLKQFFEVTGDALIYGGIAKNILLSGRYALTVGTGETYPTLIRLPGYPFFLVACFKLFGMENYASAAWVQIGLDLAACLLLADFVRRISPVRLRIGAAHGTLWLAALCPFTAIYAASPLSEGPTLFAIVAAMWCASVFQQRPGWPPALGFTFAVTYAALLRPDGALAALAFAPALLLAVMRKTNRLGVRGGMTRMVVVCLLLATTPFAAWTWRNWHTFRVFEPLAPRYATDPGEPTEAGWVSWVKTWCLDFVSTYEVYWNVPGEVLDITKLPSRAFDDSHQHEETQALFDDYNNNGQSLIPEIDRRFAALAAERYKTHPIRTHLLLPLGRVLDMWLRPRVENLPIDLDWWAYRRHNAETRFSWFYAGLNGLYLLLAMGGLYLLSRTSTRPQDTPGAFAAMWIWMLAYILMRSALLLTVEAPEARYTLECFPMLFAAGGIALYRLIVSVLLSVLKVKASGGKG